MPSRPETNARLKRLRWLLGILFLGLAIPSAVLIRQGFVQLEVTEFRRQQLIAEDLVATIDRRLTAAIAIEDARPATDFDYATPGAGGAVQLSPLSSLASTNAFPGTIGYFEVDASGALSTPLLPDSRLDTVPADERQAKAAVEVELSNVLEANRLVRARATPQRVVQTQAEPAEIDQIRSAAFEATAEASADQDVRGQAIFDELATSIEGQAQASANLADRPEVAEESASFAEAADVSAPVTEAEVEVRGARTPPATVAVSAFAEALEPHRLGQLETGHLVLFRNAWREGERFVQGMLIDQERFLSEAIDTPFAAANLPPASSLTVSFTGTSITSLISDGASGPQIDLTPLYSTRLSPPLAAIEVAIASSALERGPGFSVLVWTTMALIVALLGGFFAAYRYGVQQIRLAHQQQNFISAVSHELKTPLTSIRMYGEMLKSGWADDEKKQTYYDYIYDEGERLSRLIDNVLQLARLNRSDASVASETVSIGELFDLLQSKLTSQTERAAFEIEFVLDTSARDATIKADIDGLTQVFINLVDNAIKFCGTTDVRRIEISGRCLNKDDVLLTVRDFGPGIPDAELKRLFELFYRPDNELTRTTSGTGIGLALVKQLITAMSGRVDVRNRYPGAEFQITLPRA